DDSPPKKCSWGFIDLSFIFTWKFLLVLLLGQFLSFCITSTIVTNTVLTIAIPTTQSLFLYITIAIIYTPITIYQYGIKRYGRMLRKKGWKYLLLALVDVEGNYFAVKGFRYTSSFSMTLLDEWALFVVVALSLKFLKAKYHISQYFGMFVCLVGLGIVIAGDLTSGGDIHTTVTGEPAPNQLLGDIFALIGASCYGLSNVYEEFCVKKRPLHEVVGQMGIWGTIISCIQLCALELHELQSLTPDART
ncbi:10706_t:CDS:2, partial [Racocetra persica]